MIFCAINNKMFLLSTLPYEEIVNENVMKIVNKSREEHKSKRYSYISCIYVNTDYENEDPDLFDDLTDEERLLDNISYSDFFLPNFTTNNEYIKENFSSYMVRLFEYNVKDNQNTSFTLFYDAVNSDYYISEYKDVDEYINLSIDAHFNYWKRDKLRKGSTYIGSYFDRNFGYNEDFTKETFKERLMEFYKKDKSFVLNTYIGDRCPSYECFVEIVQ